MLTKKDARAIRAAVLSPDSEAVFEADVSGGCGFWLIEGRGWFARMTNMRDLQAAWPRSCRVQVDAKAAIAYERLELFAKGYDEAVLDLVYRIDGEDERLVGYRAGRWERDFTVGSFRIDPAADRKALALAALQP